MPMVVERDNAEVLVSWDQPVCDGASGFMLVYGEGSGLPQKLGGAYTLGGSVCGMGTSPLLWAAPDALDGSGLLWWVVLAHDGGTVEGSWGADSAGGERNGPGADGSSGECAMVEKDTSNTCE